MILLAGGERGPLYEPTGYEEKALIPIHGEPMLSRVIGVFRKCSHVDQIVVVGSSRLDELEAMQQSSPSSASSAAGAQPSVASGGGE